MTVKKKGSGYVVAHCSGEKKGQAIDSAKPTTKAKAESRHRAIQASKHKSKK